MNPDFENLFSRFRPGPWTTDPNALAQEGRPGNGNPESQGFISDNAINADTIQANAVTAGKINADAVTAREIAANSVTASEIAANTITANEIAANTITAAQIAANTLTANEIAANAITASEIAANAVTADEIAANTITANEIAASAITATELAADSVTTNKIVAGNVTSSRIELTISGKRYGASSGTSSAPGVFFDSASSTGMHLDGFGQIVFDGAGSIIMTLGSASVTSHEDIIPGAASTYDLGRSTNRWDNLYCVTLDQSSDERLKMDIADEPLGLDFVRTLKPRVYRWRDSADTQARQAVEVDSDALERECRPHEERIRRIREQQQAGGLSDAAAEQQVAELRDLMDEIRERHIGPVREAQQKRRAGRRLHHGLVAQEVRQALDAAGIDPMDAAFWKEAPDGEQALSYTELVAPLIRATQEIAVENEALRGRVEALESSASGRE